MQRFLKPKRMSSMSKLTKQQFRQTYKAHRATLTTENIDEASLAIANNALKLQIWEGTYYHLFLSISEKKEVDTQYLLHILQGRDKSVVVSKSDFNTLEMAHFLLQENTILLHSKYGIPEPKDGIELLPKQIDVVFVPLLAFDIKGNRLGYGKGFYDRFLEKCRKDTILVGLSLFEAEDKLPQDPNDVPLDYCITPKKIYTF